MFFSDCLKLVLKVFRYPQKFVAAALIGADIDAVIICPPPPDGVILRPPPVRVLKQFCDRRLLC